MLHGNARKDLVSTTPTSIALNIPDAPGLNDQPGLSNLVIDSIRGCVYVGASAVVNVYLRWNDPANGTNPQFMLLYNTTVSAAAQTVVFAFAPFMDENGLALPAPLNGAQIFVTISVGAAHSVQNSSHICANYHYE